MFNIDTALIYNAFVDEIDRGVLYNPDRSANTYRDSDIEKFISYMETNYGIKVVATGSDWHTSFFRILKVTNQESAVLFKLKYS